MIEKLIKGIAAILCHLTRFSIKAASTADK